MTQIDWGIIGLGVLVLQFSKRFNYINNTNY